MLAATAVPDPRSRGAQKAPAACQHLTSTLTSSIRSIALLQLFKSHSGDKSAVLEEYSGFWMAKVAEHRTLAFQLHLSLQSFGSVTGGCL